MRLTHFVRRHIEENQRIRDHPVRASLSAFTPVTAASLCSVPVQQPPRTAHPRAATPVRGIRGEHLARLERLARFERRECINRGGNVRNPGAASRRINAKRVGNAGNAGDYVVTAQTATTNERLQRQQLNEMKGQP